MNINQIMETVKMLEDEKLDIRTLTMGISLLDCCDSDGKRARARIYEKIMRLAGNLVKVGDDLALEYGVPIINKRISVTPISLIAGASKDENYVEYAIMLDKIANELGINFIGGFSALIHKGYTTGDHRLISSIPEAMRVTERVCSSVSVASSKVGINMDGVREMGQVIKEAARLTADRDGLGCEIGRAHV